MKRYSKSPIAHGFVRKRGIATNAAPHVGAKSLGTIDIEKFFDSISERHLKNILFGNKNICRYCKFHERMTNGFCTPSLYEEKKKKSKYPCEEIKAIYTKGYQKRTGYESLFKRIIKLCTYKGYTAQGFPTSPDFANIVLRGFDKSIKKHCDEHGITVTRYADDIGVSSKTHTKKELFDLTKNKITQLLWAYDFKVNRKKVVYKSSVGRLKLCSVVVNVKMSIQRRRIRLFRNAVYRATILNACATSKKYIRRLKGFAAYVMSVDRVQGDKYMAKLKVFEKERNDKKDWGTGVIQQELDLDFSFKKGLPKDVDCKSDLEAV